MAQDETVENILAFQFNPLIQRHAACVQTNGEEGALWAEDDLAGKGWDLAIFSYLRTFVTYFLPSVLHCIACMYKVNSREEQN